jgi:hypothetical protein
MQTGANCRKTFARIHFFMNRELDQYRTVNDEFDNEINVFALHNAQLKTQ